MRGRRLDHLTNGTYGISTFYYSFLQACCLEVLGKKNFVGSFVGGLFFGMCWGRMDEDAVGDGILK